MKKLSKSLTIIIVIMVITVITTSPALAAKSRVRPAGTSAASTQTSGFAIATAKLRSDRLALVVNFINLNQLSSVSYSLIYTANGVGQGVQGSVSTEGQTSISRELLFGTCSKNVCTYHYGIRDMRLVITGKTNTGSTVVKRFRVKV